MTSDLPQRRGDAEDFYGMRVGAALAANSVSDIHAVVRG